MALSNIFREPRREITETVIGIAAFGIFGAADYLIANRVHGWFTDVPVPAQWIIGTIIGTVSLFFLFLLVEIIHDTGEIICNWLNKLGIDPRPERRY